jgi:hypothetical protein
VEDSVALADVSFEMGGSTGNGFGGQTSPPMQFDGAYGDLETQPHNMVDSTPNRTYLGLELDGKAIPVIHHGSSTGRPQFKTSP